MQQYFHFAAWPAGSIWLNASDPTKLLRKYTVEQ
jgi:hypothetical protein